MQKCRDCQQKVLWCEIETKNGTKKIPVDPKPVDGGDLALRPSHPDQPMIATKYTGYGARFISHRKTCPERDMENDYKEREPSWVREPEGY